MRPALDLLRSERRARWFLAAFAQSALGNGAAYVALVLLAYDRFESPWAISLILLADFLPAVLLGSLLGAAADRWPRRACMVAADLLRAGAFAAIVFAGSFELTLALAAAAGSGTALFKPAALASLPGLVEPDRLPAATSLYGALTEIGFTAGPAIAAGVMIFASPEALLAANAVSFAVSALVLARLAFGERAPEPEGGRSSLLADTRAGLSTVMRQRDLRALVLVSTALVGVGAVVTVAELLLATEVFGTGESGYSILLTAAGVGMIAGALFSSRGGRPAALKRGFVLAILFDGLMYVVAGSTDYFAVAVACFGLAGVANGVLLAYSRMLIQMTVRDQLLGRVFGVENAFVSAAFAVAFVAGGALVSAFGPRAVVVGAGAATALMWLVAAAALKESWRDGEPARVPVRPAPEPAA